LLLTLLRPATAAVVAGAALWVVQSNVSQWPAGLIGLDFLIYGTAYLSVWLIMPGGRAQLRQFFILFDELRN
jgi:hypothetical protein